MDDFLGASSWSEPLITGVAELGASLRGFLPQLTGAVVMLVGGWLVAKLLEILLRWILVAFGLDRRSAGRRMADTLHRAGVTSPPSGTLGRLLFWAVMLAFGVAALRALEIEAITSTVDRILAYLPGLVAAGLIIGLGVLAGRLARRLVGSAAAAANVPQAHRLGVASGNLLVLFVLVLALEQLGVDMAFLVTLLGVLIAGVCLTMGTTLALGARPVVTHILAGHFLRKTLPRGASVEVQGRRGTLERVGPVETLLRDHDHAWSVPNAVLLEETIGR